MRVKFCIPTLLVLFLASASVCLFNREAFSSAPWDTYRAISFPTGAVLTGPDGLVVAAHGGKRLTGLDGRGHLVWQKDGGRRESGFYSVTLLGSAENGGAWMLNNVQSAESGSCDRFEVCRVTARGKVLPPSWSRVTRPDEVGDFSRTPFFVTCAGGLLHYCIVDAGGNTEFREVSLLTGTDTLLRSFPGLNAYQYVFATYDDARKTGWFLDNNSCILEWGLDGKDPLPVFGNPPVDGRRIMVPTDLRVLPGDSRFFLLDGKGQLVCVDGKGKPSRIFTAESAGRPLYLTGFLVSDSGKFVFANEAGHEVLVWDPSVPGSLRAVNGGHASFPLVLASWAVWMTAAFGLACLLVFFLVFYINVMQRRTPLLLKQLGIFLPLIIGAVVAISVWIYRDMMTRYTGEVEKRQLVWCLMGSALVDPSDIDALGFGSKTQGEIMASPAFARLTGNLCRIVNDNADEWNSSTYDYLYIPAGDDWYIFDQFTYFERYLPKQAMLEVVRTGKPQIVTYQDAYSTWLSGFAPVLRPDGSVAALFEVSIDKYIFEEIHASFRNGLFWSLAIDIIILAAVTFLSTSWLLFSIRSLQHSALQMSKGKYDVQVNIRSRDEIEDLGQVFNQMSREIQSYVERVVELNKANAKFVPSQFLTYLGKESIADIKLGDQVQREMTVLFSDIRAFTTLSERMTPEENFNFINRYLMETGPVIRTNGGFIDKYIGDAIMALFPNNPEDGLKAAIGMFQSLDRFNKGGEEIHIGVGLHTGKLMLGIIGEAERFDGTVISDAVNLASRMESLTKYYGACILISGQTLDLIPDKSFFESRLLDRVLVKGKSEPVSIYEILVPGHENFQLKLATRPFFSQALEAYFSGNFEQATREFECLQEENPLDKALSVYLQRMKQNAGLREFWTGVTMLDSK